MIKSVNEKIFDEVAVECEERLNMELEERIELACWINSCGTINTCKDFG